MAALLTLTMMGDGGCAVLAQSAPWVALRRPEHFALIRHGLAPGNNDPPGFRLDDCATERNLSTEGRAQAVRIGDLFRINGIAAARVHSSQWCHCLESANLIGLGEVQPQPLLNSFVQDRTHGVRQVEALRPWIAQLDLATPTMFVTHQVVVTALSEIFPGNGEIVVMQRTTDGRLAVQDRLPTA